MSALQSLENSLDDVFAKKAPALPNNSKKALVEWLPWINLVFGVLALWVAWGLWHWAHVANGLDNLADSLNRLSAAYGGPTVATHRLSTMVWVSLIVMAFQAVLYIAAFPALKARKKSGWNLMFYALLVNIAYGVVVMFSDYGSAGNLIGAVVESAIGFYLLFQIRSSYSKVTA